MIYISPFQIPKAIYTALSIQATTATAALGLTDGDMAAIPSTSILTKPFIYRQCR